MPGDFPEASRSVPFEGQHGFVIMMADALESLRQIAAAARLEVTTTIELSKPSQYVHEVGTARMGFRPSPSARGSL